MVDAEKIKNIVKKTGKNIVSSTQKIPAHKHCRICHEPIPVSVELRVCNNQECIEKHEKDEKNQKVVRIAMFVFFGLFALPYLFALGMQVVG